MNTFLVNSHASILLHNDIYIDPFKIPNSPHNATIIFITHEHYDHLSIEDIKKVIKEDTVIVCNAKCIGLLIKTGISESFVINNIQYDRYIDVHRLHNGLNYVKNIGFKAFPAYNINKPYHPKDGLGVGYYIEVYQVNKGNVIHDKVLGSYLVLGDTDYTKELRDLVYINNNAVKERIPRPKVLFVPIGGTYTMNAIEGSKCANNIKPEIVVPIHYGSIVGTKLDEKIFIDNLDKEIIFEILVN